MRFIIQHFYFLAVPQVKHKNESFIFYFLRYWCGTPYLYDQNVSNNEMSLGNNNINDVVGNELCSHGPMQTFLHSASGWQSLRLQPCQYCSPTITLISNQP